MEAEKRTAGMLADGDAICLAWANGEKSDDIYVFSGTVVGEVGFSIVQNYGRDNKGVRAVHIRPASIEDGGDLWAMNGFRFFIPEEEYVAQCVAGFDGDGDEVVTVCWGLEKEKVVERLDEWLDKRRGMR